MSGLFDESIEQPKIEIVINYFKAVSTFEVISQITNLSIEDINLIIKEKQ